MKRAQMLENLFLLVLCAVLVRAQQTVATNTNVAVPPLVNFSGTLADADGKPITGTVAVAVTFSLYSEQTGGAALWMESQTVQPDINGRYSVMLGATSTEGLPPDLFSSGQVRWLGVQVQGETYEQPRVMLLSVPYAMKAGDAATVGGLPPSAFVLAAPSSGGVASATTSSNPTQPGAPPAGSVTGSGTADYIPLWTTTSNLGDSILFQSGTGGTAKVGISNTTPAATLDVKGTATLRGTTTVLGLLTLPATGAATATVGKNSEPVTQAASAYNSGNSTAVSQTFEWQAEPANNDTSTASGTLNLLFGQGTAKPSETGLHIASDGQITFAKGQTFPGTGDGTITGVTAGTDLTGGGASGTVTLNLDTTKVPLLAAANTFTGNQTVNGTLTATSLNGNGAGLSNVTAKNSNELGGLASNAFAQLAANNTFSGTQTINNTTLIAGSNGNGVLQVTGSSYETIVGTATDMSGTAVEGIASATTGGAVGVKGNSAASAGYGVVGSSPNVGVYGQADGASNEGSGFGAAGVWGDTAGSGGFAGVLGTADINLAGFFVNNTSDYPTLLVENSATVIGTPVFETTGSAGIFGPTCTITIAATLICSGTVSGVVNVGDARRVSLYAMQSSENWFEDAGSGQLSNGSASIAIDPTFAQTVNTGVEYHVFLTPKGNCEGLYVSNETPQGFEVHELRGGHASIAFDYRIMAKRVGYENVRLADVTEQYQKLQKQQQLRRERMRQRSAARSAAGPVAAASLPAHK